MLDKLSKLLDFLKENWENVLLGLLLFQKAMKEFFGLSMLGRKLYKGAPGLWKRMMRGATYRKEIHDKLDRIEQQVQINGGKSMKDIVLRIEERQNTQTEVIKTLKAAVDYGELRLNLIDQSNDRMVFKLDNKGRCIFINSAFLKFFGYTESDIMGYSYESIIHHDDRKEVVEKVQRAIETKNSFYSEHRIYDIRGEVIECIVRAWPLLDMDQNVMQFYGVCDEKIL